MADKKISALTSASTPLAGTEVLPIVQSGATVKVAVSDLTAGRAVNVASLTATGNLAASNQQFNAIAVGTIAGLGSSTVTLLATGGADVNYGVDIFITGYEATNGGAVYMKAQAIVNGVYPKYGIGSINYNESLGGNDYRAYAGATLAVSISSNNLRLTITNLGVSALQNVSLTCQVHS
jgi:predicted RecA/RadA family phage recombinase